MKTGENSSRIGTAAPRKRSKTARQVLALEIDRDKSSGISELRTIFSPKPLIVNDREKRICCANYEKLHQKCNRLHVPRPASGETLGPSGLP
jgi:hypothetical protein